MRKLLLILVLIVPLKANAVCPTGNMLNFITQVNWGCMFPITIGGLTLFGDGEESAAGQGSPICSCIGEGSLKFGLRLGFWEPARIIDTVKDAYCMMPLGIDLGMSANFLKSGSHSTARGPKSTFAQTHYYIYPVLALLDMYYDLPCLNYGEADGDVDIALITEVLPFWQNDMMAQIVNPEAVLFANPAAQLACLADAVAATAGKPLDPLFWCLGSWGTTFPLAGEAGSADMVEAHALLAMRTVQLMARSGALKEFKQSGCGQAYTPVFTKSHYKLHMVVPTRSTCFKPGASVLYWGNGLAFTDNHSWMLFRKVTCCGY